MRLYDRVHDARIPGRKTVLASNGEVVEIRALTESGMIVRNDAGVEGLVAWRKIQAHQDAPVRLTYGYAMTVDTAQGSTATEHIHALPAGSHAIHGFKPTPPPAATSARPGSLSTKPRSDGISQAGR